jgi:apolipoprotein D and lipocalin family protein
MIRVVSIALVALASCVLAVSASAGKESSAPMHTVSEVDLERYDGRWYEIARLPNKFQDDCTGNVTADYVLREDGRVSVVNRCDTADGKGEEAEGVARVVDEVSNAKLEVRFAPAFLSFISAVWGDYWVIDLAPDYGYAVVGEPRRRYLWILSRTPQLEQAMLEAILERIETQGYDRNHLIFTPQGD